MLRKKIVTKFCAGCENEVEVKVKITKPRWYMGHRWKKVLGREYNFNLEYHRYICTKCGTELLIDK